jgi:hemolysin activation/secretion protein
LIGLLALPAVAAVPAPEADPTMLRFDILEYEVQGNSQLSDLEIERAVTPFLGPERTLKDVDAARVALENAYRDAGYLTVVVTIPEQKVDDGIVILSVLEGKVERLRVKGAEYHLASGIKQQVPELAEGKVPYFPKVQRELDAVNRRADLKATPALKAGRTPGTVDVSLEVDDHLPFYGNVELNNRQSPGTRPLRLAASARYDNLWQLGHSIGLTAQTAPQAVEQMKVLAANYVLPVDARGDALALYAVHSSSNVPGPTSVLNNSDIAGLRFALPLPATSDYSHSLSLGLDYKNIHRVQGLVAGSLATTLQPAITYVPLVAAYNGAWLENGGSTALDATATLGVRGLFGNRDSEFDAKRPGASAQFLALRTGVQQTETFARWTVSGRAEVQLASGLLLPNEQYAAGGVDTVRGYKESEQTGDRAFRISLEVRTPGVQVGSGAWPLRLTGVGFYDAARLELLQYNPVYATTLPSVYHVLRGAGVGLRLSAPKGLSFDLDLARALTDGGNDSINTRAGDYRVHSRLVWEFL